MRGGKKRKEKGKMVIIMLIGRKIPHRTSR